MAYSYGHHALLIYRPASVQLAALFWSRHSGWCSTRSASVFQVRQMAHRAYAVRLRVRWGSSPQLSGGRSVDFILFSLCLYFGFVLAG